MDPATSDDPPCPECSGTGEVEVSPSGHPLDPDSYTAPCPACSPVLEDEREPDPEPTTTEYERVDRSEFRWERAFGVHP